MPVDPQNINTDLEICMIHHLKCENDRDCGESTGRHPSEEFNALTKSHTKRYPKCFFQLE